MSAFYKVVRLFNGSLRSANITEHELSNKELEEQGCNLEYAEGKITVPKIPNSKLFVFDDLEAANSWIGGDEGFQIWEVEVTNPEPAPFYETSPVIDTIKRFWNMKAKNESLQWFDTGYPNTFFVDSVKLIRRVY